MKTPSDAQVRRHTRAAVRRFGIVTGSGAVGVEDFVRHAGPHGVAIEEVLLRPRGNRNYRWLAWSTYAGGRYRDAIVFDNEADAVLFVATGRAS
jgi:hypothetical protein